MRHFALGSLLLLASAQLGLAATIEVKVGGPGTLKFDPSTVNANVGDVIRFTFLQKNHTVTQSTLAAPCVRMQGGFDSGFMAVADAKTSDFPQANLTVDRTGPLWAYCRQGSHCSAGMIFSVNPGNDLAAFQAAAAGGATSSRPASVSSTSTSVPTPGTSTPSSTDHKVIVGGPGILTFTPSNITAQVGDTITFEFRQKNHTVTASSFEKPCEPLSASGQAGFDSGYQPVADGASTFPRYVVQVNDTKPIWAYCKQGNHCRSGMVFAANTAETTAKNFEAFQNVAKQEPSTSGYPSSAAWRPAVGSPLMGVFVGLSAAVFLL